MFALLGCQVGTDIDCWCLFTARQGEGQGQGQVKVKGHFYVWSRTDGPTHGWVQCSQDV